MENIRIQTGLIKIQVNDHGEYIVLNFNDQSFAPRYFNMLENFKGQENIYIQKAQEIDNMDIAVDEYGISNKTKAGMNLNLEIHEYFKTQVDNLFGVETCRKVFGDIVASVELYAEFFEALKPYFDKYAKERQTKLKKYSPGRKGNV